MPSPNLRDMTGTKTGGCAPLQPDMNQFWDLPEPNIVSTNDETGCDSEQTINSAETTILHFVLCGYAATLTALARKACFNTTTCM